MATNQRLRSLAKHGTNTRGSHKSSVYDCIQCQEQSTTPMQHGVGTVDKTEVSCSSTWPAQTPKKGSALPRAIKHRALTNDIMRCWQRGMNPSNAF